MYKRTDSDGKEILVIEQSDLDNSVHVDDLDYLVDEDNISGGVGGVGRSIFENDYIDKYKYMMGAFSCISPIRNFIHVLELEQFENKINELQIKTYDYGYKSIEGIVNRIENIDSYILDRDSQIATLKSQLKHCKNPLQKLNMEREMNKLIRERNRR